MKVVIDTNRIIAALLKDNTTRNILLNNQFEFITPDHTLKELDKHKEELRNKIGLEIEEFDLLVSLMFEQIEIISESEYKEFFNECYALIEIDDIPFLALALANKAPIWTHDAHFSRQSKARVLSNKDLLDTSP